jgi:hypothetical protein
LSSSVNLIYEQRCFDSWESRKSRKCCSRCKDAYETAICWEGTKEIRTSPGPRVRFRARIGGEALITPVLKSPSWG